MKTFIILLVIDIMMTLSTYFFLTEKVIINIVATNKKTGEKVVPNERSLKIITIIFSILWFITIPKIAYDKVKNEFDKGEWF